MVERPRIPVAPLALGLGGLLPFWGLAALLAAHRSGLLGLTADGARTALATYGAIIASFLGGLRWGAALNETKEAGARDFGLSVVPSLAAWACLALPGAWALAALAALIGIWGFVDQDLPRRGLAPPWLGRLRTLLSGGAALALGLATLG